MNGKKKRKFEYKDIISWVIGGLGIAATIFAAIKTETNGFGVTFVSILVSELVLLGFWVAYLYELRKWDREKGRYIAEIEELQRQIKAISKRHGEEEERHKQERDVFFIKIRQLTSNIKNASKLNNDFNIKIPEASENAYRVLDTLQRSGINNSEVLKNEMQCSVKDYAKGLHEIFKRYSSNMLTISLEIQETYLRLKGMNHTVSATIKLFKVPFTLKDCQREQVIVYTAFRDKATYERREREIGGISYTIDGNSDFVQCLRKDQFVINNAKKGSDNYLNEHLDFDQYYNCATVVPIKSKISNGEYRYYGYLCCDCLNEDACIQEVFDTCSAQCLFAMAQQYATFLENLDSNWIDRMQDMEGQPTSFMEVIFQRTYIGK